MGREESYEMEEQSELFYAVMNLPGKYRTVIHLFYYEGYTVKEIAELLDEKVTTITTRLGRGREHRSDKPSFFMLLTLKLRFSPEKPQEDLRQTFPGPLGCNCRD